MAAGKQKPGVLAAFEHIDAATAVIRTLRTQGHKGLTVYCSHPNHEVEDAVGHRTSPVRLFTLIGGLTGLTAAYAMQVWMNRNWPLVVGGKEIVAIPAFIVVMFELTVLVGSLLTLFGVAFLSLVFRNPGVAYDPRFTDDRIGVFVPATGDQARQLEELFRRAGAVEVKHASA